MAYFILPVKIKWLAWLAAGFLALNLIQHWILIVPTFFALLNYLVAFGPALVSGRLQAAKVSQRRERYEAASLPSAAFFHQCKVCGKTEIDDPSLEFRVTDEGEEICSVCRSAKA